MASQMGALSWGLELANFEGVPVALQGFEMAEVQMLWSVFMREVWLRIQVRSTYLPDLPAAYMLGLQRTAWMQ